MSWNRSFKPGGITAAGFNRTGVSAGVVALVGIIGLTYVLTEIGVQPLAVKAEAPAVLVEFTAGGKLMRPVGHCKRVYIGTPLTPNDLNNGAAAFPVFHADSIDPESFAHCEKTSRFRDGAVLIKELGSVGAKQATSGKGRFMVEFTGLEASIKDAKRTNV